METRKNLDGVVKNSAEKKKHKTGSQFSLARFSFDKKRFFSGFNLAVSFVLFAVLLLGFWFTFETFALNPPTANPPTGGGNALSVDGSGTVFVGGGTGKLNAGTIDPIYDILGVKYATYVAGMIGQKEEISGTLTLQPTTDNQQLFKYTVDFDEQPVGSDLWLFGKITDFKKNWSGLSVLLTPEFAGEVWYEKNPSENQLVFYASPIGNWKLEIGNSQPEISFRLSAPRFDWRQWPNLLEDQSVSGFKVE
jgi:hypothetical protein